LADVELTGPESSVEVCSGEPVVFERQIGGSGTHPETQRIERCCLMSTQTVCQDQAQDFNLLFLVLGAYAASGNRRGAALVLGQEYEMITDRGMRNVGGRIAVGRKLLEVRAPL